MVGDGAIAAWTGVVLLSLAAAWGLALIMEIWLAFLIVGLVWLGIAAALAAAGRRELGTGRHSGQPRS